MIEQLVDQARAGSVQNGIRQERLALLALLAGEEHHLTKAAWNERLAREREWR